MYKQTKETLKSEILNTHISKRKGYIQPLCETMVIDTENFICTSVTPSAGSSTTPSSSTGWGLYEQEHSGGTIYVGGSSVSPAKHSFFTDEEDNN